MTTILSDDIIREVIRKWRRYYRHKIGFAVPQLVQEKTIDELSAFVSESELAAIRKSVPILYLEVMG